MNSMMQTRPSPHVFFLTFYKYVEFLNILYGGSFIDLRIHHLQYLFEIVWH